MRTKLLTFILLASGIICFDALFWKENIGINLFIFSALLIAYAIQTSREALQKKEIYLSITLVFISGCMTILHHSTLSIFMLFLTTFISLGLIKQQKLFFAFEGLIGFFISYIFSPFLWINRIAEEYKRNRTFTIIFKSIKLIVIPILLFLLFFSIYREANPKFANLTNILVKWINALFADISVAKIIFILFGFTLLLFSLYRFGSMMKPFISHSETLKRIKGNHSNNLIFSKNPFSALINEFKVGVLIFGILNILLLIVNILDINWIWFGFEVPLDFNLKQFVHEGTYLLILSILLSISIFLYFFRNSLNFYPKNKWLKRLGKLWIVQNMILVFSVFMRNYHYMDYHGLAGKRIGVIAFLIFTLVGLVTLIVKVEKLKTFSYLIRVNSWFVLVSLTLMSCINWDRAIVYHNLTHHNPGEIDVDYYLKLSPTVAPILFKNISKIEEQIKTHSNRVDKEVWFQYLDINLFKKQLEYNTAQYLTKIDTLGWPSWNYANYKLMKETRLIPVN